MNREAQVELAKKARQNLKRFQKFFGNFKRKPGDKIDEIFHSTQDEVFAHTDCTQCGNCCKVGTPVFSNRDIDLIARSFRMKAGDFSKQYLKQDKEGDMVLQTTPCTFLGEDNMCSIYDFRPEDCRNFPHTRRKPMGSKINVVLTNTAVCPAAMEIVEKIMQDHSTSNIT